MKKAILETRIHIDNSKINEVTEGILQIKATENLQIDRIEAVIYFEVRGKLASTKEEIDSFTICTHKMLEKEVVEEIPISFELSGDNLPTYKGTNAIFSYKIEVNIEVNEADIDKIERSFFSKVKSLVTADNSFKKGVYFSVKDEKSEYKVVETKVNFSLQFNVVISFLTTLFVGVIYAYFIPEFEEMFIFLGVIIIVTSVFIVAKIVKQSLGVVTMETLKDEDAFLCKIHKPRNLNFTQKKLYYHIIEKVIDNRGTSSRTYTQILYRSPYKEIKKLKQVPIVKFNFPEREGLHSFEYEDVSILWRMYIEGKAPFGITLKYKADFTVEKKR
ncbi:hypothetical protein [Tenacibaculum sp. 190524A02b]|uniref:hypothetical protein n=1 Tax=Tenacibaculum vairaonense TaxID=3137860 RepID=UPI0031FAC257